mmetsp:Transcript_161147/g.517252  ORF Transcript_161147/g.517252 Transcript_161147/m.517252 type:complete len:214 (+) Transcript_161147:3225-3866(+)
MSRSVKSKVPRFGQVTAFRMINSCTRFEFVIARACHAINTWHALSTACGSLRLRSMRVSCASLRVRKRRWHCWVSTALLPGKVSTSRKMSFHVWSTPRHVSKRSLANFKMAATTPLQSPKRSGNSSPRHFQSSSSSNAKSPSSMAVCSGGSSRSTILTCSVISCSMRSCASVFSRISRTLCSAAAFSSATWRWHSSRSWAIFLRASACWDLNS